MIVLLIGTFSVKLPKLHPGESFDGLDLLTTLLAPKKKAPATIRPLIELAGKHMTVHCHWELPVICSIQYFHKKAPQVHACMAINFRCMGVNVWLPVQPQNFSISVVYSFQAFWLFYFLWVTNFVLQIYFWGMFIRGRVLTCTHINVNWQDCYMKETTMEALLTDTLVSGHLLNYDLTFTKSHTDYIILSNKL